MVAQAAFQEAWDMASAEAQMDAEEGLGPDLPAWVPPVRSEGFESIHNVVPFSLLDSPVFSAFDTPKRANRQTQRQTPPSRNPGPPFRFCAVDSPGAAMLQSPSRRNRVDGNSRP